TPKISGPHAQRLLAGGWWGFVRHPNYLGTLLMVYAAAMLSGFASPIPWTYPLLLTAAMLHRVGRTEYLNAEKYGSSWTVYTKLVPNKLIPRIY
ncbi:lamin-B receptor, partial [Clonorchis sinensis]